MYIMNSTSKTIDSLNFEDLEPHRFEDLIRQLIYDFRDWSSLEANGRIGLNDGFDGRGREAVTIEEDLETEEYGIRNSRHEDRLWLIQYRAEKKIGPQKIKNYIDEVTNNNDDSIYGIIFAASSDFSKKTRDVFRVKCREYNLNECYLWGRAEIEEMLFQPKNDLLLFTYFGVSLTIRRKSLKTNINSRLTIKREAIKHLGPINGRANHLFILLRDPNETKYPYKDEIRDFDDFPRWKIFQYLGHYHDGLKFLLIRYMAYLDDDRMHWDYIKEMNLARPSRDPWGNNGGKESVDRFDAIQFWEKIPNKNRGYFEVECFLAYDKILAIDEHGDRLFPHPHIYVPFYIKDGPFESFQLVTLKTVAPPYDELRFPDEKNIVKYFPDEFPRADVPELQKQTDPVEKRL